MHRAFGILDPRKVVQSNSVSRPWHGTRIHKLLMPVGKVRGRPGLANMHIRKASAQRNSSLSDSKNLNLCRISCSVSGFLIRTCLCWNCVGFIFFESERW